MSLEAWGDDGGADEMSGYVTDDRAKDMAIAAAQVMREMLARFIEQGGDAVTAESVRANWIPSWGEDPGKFDGPIPADVWQL